MMKKILSLIGMFAILFSTPALAQEREAVRSVPKQGKVVMEPHEAKPMKKIREVERGSNTPEARATAASERLFRSLGLSDSQKTQVYDMYLASGKKMQGLYTNYEMGGAEKKEKINALRGELQQQIIDEVLNESQAEKFRQMIEKRSKQEYDRSQQRPRPMKSN